MSDQDSLSGSRPDRSSTLGLDISHELIETLAAGNVQPTTAMIGVTLDHLHIVGRCILADDLDLVFRRILLMLVDMRTH